MIGDICLFQIEQRPEKVHKYMYLITITTYNKPVHEPSLYLVRFSCRRLGILCSIHNCRGTSSLNFPSIFVTSEFNLFSGLFRIKIRRTEGFNSNKKQNRDIKYFFTNTLIHKFYTHSAENLMSQVRSEFSSRKYITWIQPFGIFTKISLLTYSFRHLFKSEQFFEPVIIFVHFLSHYCFLLKTKYRQPLFTFQ